MYRELLIRRRKSCLMDVRNKHPDLFWRTYVDLTATRSVQLTIIKQTALCALTCNKITFKGNVRKFWIKPLAYKHTYCLQLTHFSIKFVTSSSKASGLNSSSLFALLERGPGFECISGAVTAAGCQSPVSYRSDSRTVHVGSLRTNWHCDGLSNVIRFFSLSLIPQMLRIYARAHSSTVEASTSLQS
jgi:hypothetical protein